jgi:hypothetical protein
VPFRAGELELEADAARRESSQVGCAEAGGDHQLPEQSVASLPLSLRMLYVGFPACVRPGRGCITWLSGQKREQLLG